MTTDLPGCPSDWDILFKPCLWIYDRRRWRGYIAIGISCAWRFSRLWVNTTRSIILYYCVWLICEFHMLSRSRITCVETNIPGIWLPYGGITWTWAWTWIRSWIWLDYVRSARSTSRSWIWLDYVGSTRSWIRLDYVWNTRSCVILLIPCVSGRKCRVYIRAYRAVTSSTNFIITGIFFPTCNKKDSIIVCLLSSSYSLFSTLRFLR